MYSSSATTGDSENFIARDVGSYIDAERGAGPANPANEEALAAVKTAEDSAKLPFGLRAQFASAAAWSPNPNNPPLYLDLPVGPNQQSVLARWAANAPLAFIDQYIQNLRQYRDRHRGGRPGHSEGRYRHAARRAGGLRHQARFRDLPGHAHEQCRVAFPRT